MVETADVVVIGAGIAGVGAGAWLAEGGARVRVLEAEAAPGYHATGRSAAMFIRNYGNATLRALNAASLPVLSGAAPEAEGSVMAPRGALMVASAAEGEALDTYLAGSEGAEEIATDAALRLCPILRPDAALRAAWEADAQDIDVHALLQAYLRRLRRAGGRIETAARVTGLSRTGGAWRVATSSGAMAAAIIVNAAGAWADHVAAMAGARLLGIEPRRRSAAILPAPEAHAVGRWPLVVSAAERWYFKPDAGRLMVSPADEDPVPAQDVQPDDMVLAEGLQRFADAVTVPVTQVLHRWAGLRSFAPDRTPVVGPDRALPGFVWLAGQGGYGVQTSPALSQLLADRVLGRRPALPGAVVAALDPGRFG